MHIQPDTPPPATRTRLRLHRRLPCNDHHHDRERVGETTPTDPRAQRNRAGRRGGHLLTRALSPPNNTGLPTLLHSRRPCPGRSHRRPTTPHLPAAIWPTEPAAPWSFIPSTNAIESLNARYRRAVRARGHFPNDAAALKCLYLVTRSLDPTGRGRARWVIRWKAALNAFAI
ncbi:MAG TPA: transposase, partial [Pseudonocardia sp.]|nr:transposase [Pseudonocardia sp.]